MALLYLRPAIMNARHVASLADLQNNRQKYAALAPRRKGPSRNAPGRKSIRTKARITLDMNELIMLTKFVPRICCVLHRDRSTLAADGQRLRSTRNDMEVIGTSRECGLGARRTSRCVLVRQAAGQSRSSSSCARFCATFVGRGQCLPPCLPAMSPIYRP